jgi:tRNA G10  N-methylase Trm11
MQSLVILGRQPALGLAELESLYGAKALKPLKSGDTLIDIAAKDIDFHRLGGAIKLATVLNILDTTDWRDFESYLNKTITEHLQYVPEGKFRLGLSAYGLRINPREINATALRLKKLIKAEGRSVRIIPNKSTALSSAQVLHNKLYNDTGWELVFYRDGNKTILALTKAEQDIEAYARRDQNRPFRDAKVGMLPPKLAQIITNLATGSDLPPKLSTSPVVLDPFCGTGVLLQEALLMGYDAYGTDIEPRMIEYSEKNLEWLVKGGPAVWKLEVGDAMKHKWSSFHTVAAETYLGKPLSREPNESLLTSIMAECDQIHRGFLSNMGKQAKKGTRICLAVPAWRYKGGFKHLRTLDYLRELGYTRIDFVHSRTRDLLYYRQDQFVARELVVLKKD